MFSQHATVKKFLLVTALVALSFRYPVSKLYFPETHISELQSESELETFGKAFVHIPNNAVKSFVQKILFRLFSF